MKDRFESLYTGLFLSPVFFFFRPSILANGFALCWIRPDTVVLKRDNLRHSNSPSFKFTHWRWPNWQIFNGGKYFHVYSKRLVIHVDSITLDGLPDWSSCCLAADTVAAELLDEWCLPEWCLIGGWYIGGGVVELLGTAWAPETQVWLWLEPPPFPVVISKPLPSSLRASLLAFLFQAWT